jgi:hypothetical protein
MLNHLKNYFQGLMTSQQEYHQQQAEIDTLPRAELLPILESQFDDCQDYAQPAVLYLIDIWTLQGFDETAWLEARVLAEQAMTQPTFADIVCWGLKLQRIREAALGILKTTRIEILRELAKGFYVLSTQSEV